MWKLSSEDKECVEISSEAGVDVAAGVLLHFLLIFVSWKEKLDYGRRDLNPDPETFVT